MWQCHWAPGKHAALWGLEDRPGPRAASPPVCSSARDSDSESVPRSGECPHTPGSISREAITSLPSVSCWTWFDWFFLQKMRWLHPFAVNCSLYPTKARPGVRRLSLTPSSAGFGCSLGTGMALARASHSLLLFPGPWKCCLSVTAWAQASAHGRCCETAGRRGGTVLLCVYKRHS